MQYRKQNQTNGAEAVVQMLQKYKVKHIFGLCGDTSLPLYDALHRLNHGITHILTRDERHAAYMADGYAKVTNKPGVCEGPSGGGATYMLPGVVEANESSIPVLAITTDIATTSYGKFALTELNQKKLFGGITKWNDIISDANQIPTKISKAFEVMTTGTPGAVHLALPFDVQKQVVNVEGQEAIEEHTRVGGKRKGAKKEDIVRVVRELSNAKKPVAVCGGGVVLSNAEAELIQLAYLLNMPVATSVSGQGAINETSPLALGVTGSNGYSKYVTKVVNEADLVLFVGCRAGSVTTERWSAPNPKTKIVHIDSEGGVIDKNYKSKVGLKGDAKIILDQIVSQIIQTKKTRFGYPLSDGVVRTKKAVTQKFAEFQKLAKSNKSPIRPERVVATLQKLLDDDAVIVADPGTPCPYFAAYYKFPKFGRHFISNRAHGALGYALAAAMGAQFGCQSKIVAAMGDGSFGFCCGELETLVRYDMPITCVVFSNATYGWIKAGQNAGFGKRFYNVDFGVTDHAKVAAAFGVKSWRVTDPKNLEKVMKAALKHGKPTLVDVVCQPLHEANAPVSEWVA